MNPRSLPILCRCAWAVVLTPLLGCGTNEYGNRYEKQLEHWKGESPFVTLYDPMNVQVASDKDATDAPFPFSIRIPRVFSDTPGHPVCYQVNSEHPDDVLRDRNGMPIKDKDGNEIKLVSMFRLQPPALLPLLEGKVMNAADGLPSLWRTYEGKFIRKSPAREFPYYCYLACGERDKDFDKRMGAIRDRLVKALPESDKEWALCDVLPAGGVAVHKGSDSKVEPWSADGRAQTCKRLVAKGTQPFYDYDSREKQRINSQDPATLELYLFFTNTHFLIVGWRYPDAVEKEMTPKKPSELAGLSISTVRMLPVAAPAKNTDAKAGKK